MRLTASRSAFLLDQTRMWPSILPLSMMSMYTNTIPRTTQHTVHTRANTIQATNNFNNAGYYTNFIFCRHTIDLPAGMYFFFCLVILFIVCVREYECSVIMTPHVCSHIVIINWQVGVAYYHSIVLRPANQHVYAVGSDNTLYILHASSSSSSGRVAAYYQSKLNGCSLSSNNTAVVYSIDFNPVADRLRIVSSM